MKCFCVDLRSYSLDERKHILNRLESLSFMCNPYLDKEHIGIFKVFWDSPYSISDMLDIPEYLITPTV